MPGSSDKTRELKQSHFELIDWVVKVVLKLGVIPSMQAIADGMGLSRQAIAKRMKSAAADGVMMPRPLYSIKWFELTPLGEELYVRKLRSLRRDWPLRQPKD